MEWTLFKFAKYVLAKIIVASHMHTACKGGLHSLKEGIQNGDV